MARGNPAINKPLKLSGDLEAVVGKGPMPRGQVVKKLWEYIKKKDLQDPSNKRNINADDFRYPGPKPQSRETAVALLADSTEATSRSLRDPTPESIRQMVRKIINDKFIDGQLDECNLSLRDLHKIQESFVHNLMAIFHTRVAYPDKPDALDKVDLFREDPRSPFRMNP